MIDNVVIDGTNMLHVFYHAMKKQGLSTNELWTIGGKCYSKKNKDLFLRAVESSFTDEFLLSVFEDERLKGVLDNSGYSEEDIKNRRDDLVKFIKTAKYNHGDYFLPTGAVKRMIDYLDSIRSSYPGAKIIVCWDNKGSRKAVGEIYERYLSHLRDKKPDVYAEMEASRSGVKYKGDGVRKKSDNDLLVQMEVSKWVIDSFGAINASIDGKEADHIIGALAHNAKNMIIVSGDKDMLQLVNDSNNVFLLPTSGGSNFKKLAVMEKQIEDKYNIPAAYMGDYLAIRGDGIDNIKGLVGFGPKKAEILINRFGSVEDIISGMNSMLDKYGSVEMMAKKQDDTGLKGISLNLLKVFFDNIIELRLCKEMVTLDDSWGIDPNEFLSKSTQRDLNKLMAVYKTLKMKEAIGRLHLEMRISNNNTSVRI